MSSDNTRVNGLVEFSKGLWFMILLHVDKVLYPLSSKFIITLRVLLSLCSALVGKCLETSIGEKFRHNYFERLWFMIYVFVAFVVQWDPYKQKNLHVI